LSKPSYSTYQLTSKFYGVNYNLKANSSSDNQEIFRFFYKNPELITVLTSSSHVPCLEQHQSVQNLTPQDFKINISYFHLCRGLDAYIADLPKMKIQVFLDVMLCRSVNSSRRFEGLVLESSGLKMKTMESFETLETIYLWVRHLPTNAG
jgi:hypothetical protein